MKVPHALPWLNIINDQILGQYDKQRLGHALLLTGQAGLGKRLYLRELSQLLLCSNRETKPCGQCASCNLFNAGSHPDLLMVEPEEKGKQIKIEQIRRVTEFVNTTAQKGQSKVVLLGPAEAMNINASNALLKSLEEPSSNVTLLLYSHQPSGLLATIKSRCQQFSIYPPEFQLALTWLQQNSATQLSPENANSVLRLASGAPLKAIELIEQDVHVQYMQFCQNMMDFQNRQVMWSDLLTKWKNWDMENLLQWFYHLLLDAQKLKSGSDTVNIAMPELRVQTQQVAQCAPYTQIERVLMKLVQSQMAFRGQANPNPVMMIESVLIDWLGLLGQSSK
ncbi:DNA polymerase III subunit delta' [Oceaniserpentilla sp. 4NH20-0058]|uniref:DNA polymerase III subunit delta' n=1 Tax=Oceaniserpentilla sp. 4NH20-0058 TaxID=3127660 RepID=UPI003106CD6D